MLNNIQFTNFTKFSFSHMHMNHMIAVFGLLFMFIFALLEFYQDEYESHRFDPSLVAKYMCKYLWLQRKLAIYVQFVMLRQYLELIV